jgi:uncharacterized protein
VEISPLIEKTYITAQQLLDDSFRMAIQIYESGYKPDYIVGVWRGGAPVGIAVQELLDVLGVETDHIAIRTSSYTGIGERLRHVTVHGLNYIIRRANAEDSMLIVDDVHDTGLSIQQIIHDVTKACKKNTPDIKIATPYFKPGHNKTDMVPDFYVHETDNWLVFPHELHGLSTDELASNKPGIDGIRDRLLALKKNLE